MPYLLLATSFVPDAALHLGSVGPGAMLELYEYMNPYAPASDPDYVT